ncbi:hypothetical protein C1T17_15955 [Sphingobium sp. SCG-1]|uniref:hypothetical protein n=1 Tax=Sphingobium sp. SCG-1 TaxID=2072936 RepID=UPI000CD6BFCF|nr:hypothetical protein [Sphingobium sp. SCG-1]AUW59359.1 hypothetical protein C1T17_15955 [Sphingobium sp. SCG-1]
MRGWISFLAMMGLFFALGAGALAHAKEGFGCQSAGTSLSAGHSDGDSDEVPADADNGMPHHHGGCHGHHASTDAARAPLASPESLKDRHGMPRSAQLATIIIDPGLRPPIA